MHDHDPGALNLNVEHLHGTFYAVRKGPNHINGTVCHVHSDVLDESDAAGMEWKGAPGVQWPWLCKM